MRAGATVSDTGQQVQDLISRAEAAVAGARWFAARIGPEKMRELMMAVYEACAEAVARYEGRVTKYSGDGVLAQFGHPIAHEDDARRAVLAAMAVVERVEQSGPPTGRHSSERASRFEPGSIRASRPSVRSTQAHGSPEELAGDPPNVATRVQARPTR